MSKGSATTLSKALQNWEAQHPGQSFVDALQIKLCFQFPPIQKLETTVLAQLSKCEKLSISSNNIDKIANFPPMKSLIRLSLGRNLIKKISGLDQIAGNLRQLWLSYNIIQKLQGVSGCLKLTTFFISSYIFIRQQNKDLVVARQNQVVTIVIKCCIYWKSFIWDFRR